MIQYAEKTSISLKPEQHQILVEMALREGQDVETFVEHLLQNIIEKQRAEAPSDKDERIRQNFDRIRQHRKAFLVKRNNEPLNIDTVTLLNQLRDERDEHQLSLAD